MKIKDLVRTFARRKPGVVGLFTHTGAARRYDARGGVGPTWPPEQRNDMWPVGTTPHRTPEGRRPRQKGTRAGKQGDRQRRQKRRGRRHPPAAGTAKKPSAVDGPRDVPGVRKWVVILVVFFRAEPTGAQICSKAKKAKRAAEPNGKTGLGAARKKATRRAEFGPIRAIGRSGWAVLPSGSSSPRAVGRPVVFGPFRSDSRRLCRSKIVALDGGNGI